jgi:hypothetical protein
MAKGAVNHKALRAMVERNEVLGAERLAKRRATNASPARGMTVRLASSKCDPDIQKTFLTLRHLDLALKYYLPNAPVLRRKRKS